MNTSIKANVIGNMTLWTSRLVDVLKDGKIGDEFTDEQLTVICEHDVKESRGGTYVRSACNHVKSNYGLFWRRVRGSGMIRCLNNTEKREFAKSCTKSINRTSKRALTALRTIDFDMLPANEKQETLVLMAQHGTLATTSKHGTLKKLTDKMVTRSINLPKLLEAMS